MRVLRQLSVLLTAIAFCTSLRNANAEADPGSSSSSIQPALGPIPGICPQSLPLTVYGTFNSSSPVTTGQLKQDGIISTCEISKSCPGLADAFPHAYKAYPYANNTGTTQCVTTTAGTYGCSSPGLMCQAYHDSFDPANICTNYLADQGINNSFNAQGVSYSFVVNPGQTFVVVVSDVTTGSNCQSYALSIIPGSCEGSVEFTSDSNTTLATSTGWSQFGNTTAEQSTTFDVAHGSLLSNITTDNGGNWRIIGWITNAGNTLPYSAVGPEKYIRSKFYVYADDQAGPAINQIPNFRMRIANRFAVTSLLAVNTHNNADPEAAKLSQDIRPSTSPAAPSIYRVDMDPVDVPYLVNNPATEGFLAAIETYEPDPQANGNIALTELTIGTYPALLPLNVLTINTTGTPQGLIKQYLTDQVSDGDFGTGNIASSNSAATIAKYHNGVLEAGGPQPGFELTSAGVTLQTLNVESDRFGVAAFDVFNTIADLTHHLTRARFEANKQYRFRFHATSTNITTSQSVVRFRARTIKFQYTASMEVGGATAASVQSNAIAAQALPGVGNQIPSIDRYLSNENGGWYNVMMISPLSADIQPSQPNLLAQDPPGVDTQPANNSKSRRDLQFGFDVLDTFSSQPTSGDERGQMTVSRVEIMKYDLVPD